MPSTVSQQFNTVLRKHAVMSVGRRTFVASCAFSVSCFVILNTEPTTCVVLPII